VPSTCIRSQKGGTPALMHSLHVWSLVAHVLTNASYRSVTPHHHMQELVSLSRSLIAAECSLSRLYCAVQESMASYPCANQLLGLGHIDRDYIACPYLVHDNQLELLPLTQRKVCKTLHHQSARLFPYLECLRSSHHQEEPQLR